MSDEILILRDLSDEELDNLSVDELDKMDLEYKRNGIPDRATVKGLLSELGVKYDDLSDFILGLSVGVCNSASRNDDRIVIYRKQSPIKDNFIINLNEDYDVPDITIQFQVSDDFVHEEAYNEDGLLLYRT